MNPIQLFARTFIVATWFMMKFHFLRFFNYSPRVRNVPWAGADLPRRLWDSKKTLSWCFCFFFVVLCFVVAFAFCFCWVVVFLLCLFWPGGLREAPWIKIVRIDGHRKSIKAYRISVEYWKWAQFCVAVAKDRQDEFFFDVAGDRNHSGLGALAWAWCAWDTDWLIFAGHDK